MRRKIDYHSIASELAIVNVWMTTLDKVDGDAVTIGSVHIDPVTLNYIEAIHDVLLLHSDNHVLLENNP